MGILTTCKPRPDVLSGDLKDAIFAADFGDVISNHPGTPEVYRDPQLFFRNTHPARDLVRIVREVFSVLSTGEQPGLALRLSTGFGGGKTHTLLTLWHLARNIGASEMGTELLPAAGRPKQVHVAAAVKKLGVAEDVSAQPTEVAIEAFLPDGSVPRCAGSGSSRSRSLRR